MAGGRRQGLHEQRGEQVFRRNPPRVHQAEKWVYYPCEVQN